MIILDNIIFEIQKAGGVSAVWKSVIEAVLAEEVLDVNFLDSGLGVNNLFYPAGLPKRGYTTEWGPLNWRRYQTLTLPKKCTVFHSSYFRTSKQPHIKNIVTIHDFVYEKYDKGMRQKIHLWQKKQALKRSATIICVSENTRQDLLEFHPEIAPDKVKVVHNGVGEEFCPLDYVRQGKPYLIYVGGRNAHKNFPAALNILRFPEAEKMELELLCIGGGEFSHEELAQISKLGLFDRVSHRGGLPSEVLNKLYNAAFALIYPSYYEGFGIPPLEAMAAGCPVIASDASSIPEVVGDAALMFAPDQVAECEPFLAQLSCQVTREKIRQEGITQAKKFTWQDTGQKTVQIYKDLMS